MEYFLCPDCVIGYKSWSAFVGHCKLTHQGAPIPEKEEVEKVPELPEGYTLSKWARGKKPKEEVTPPTPSVEKFVIPEKLPEGIIERTELSLSIHGFPEGLKQQIVNVLTLHPEAQENPNNYFNLLQTICSTYRDGAMHAKKVGLVITEVFPQMALSKEYYAAAQQGPGYGAYGQATTPGYSGWGAQPQQDSFSQYMQFLMQREMRAEREKPAGLPPEISNELAAVRNENKEIKDFMRLTLERMDKQEEEEKYEKGLSELRGTISKLEDKLERKPEGSGKDQWLDAYLKERDKREESMHDRYQSTISELGDKLADATKAVGEARKEADTKIAESLLRDKKTRDDTVDEMKRAGWKSKDKTKEELDHDILVEALQIIPDKIDKGFDKIAEKIPSPPGIGRTAETPPHPRTPQEVAAQIELENQILKEAGRRGKA